MIKYKVFWHVKILLIIIFHYSALLPKVVYTVKKCSWGWANLSPETCRVDLKRLINEKVVASCWLFTLLHIGFVVAWFVAYYFPCSRYRIQLVLFYSCFKVVLYLFQSFPFRDFVWVWVCVCVCVCVCVFLCCAKKKWVNVYKTDTSLTSS